MKYIFIYILVCFNVCNLYSQITNDTILLPEVLLEESKIKNFSIGVDYEIFNTLLTGISSTSTLSDHLTNYSNIYKRIWCISNSCF